MDFRVSDESNQYIDTTDDTIGDTEGKSVEPTTDELLCDGGNFFDDGTDDITEEISNTIDIFEEDSIENTGIDPLFIDQPNLNLNVDMDGPIEEIAEQQNLIFIDGLPKKNITGRPVHGQLICAFCGFIATQQSRLLTHIDSHSTEKKYKCEWIDPNGIACDKKYRKKKELTAHQRLKQHKKD